MVDVFIISIYLSIYRSIYLSIYLSIFLHLVYIYICTCKIKNRLETHNVEPIAARMVFPSPKRTHNLLGTQDSTSVYIYIYCSQESMTVWGAAQYWELPKKNMVPNPTSSVFAYWLSSSCVWLTSTSSAHATAHSMSQHWMVCHAPHGAWSHASSNGPSI